MSLSRSSDKSVPQCVALQVSLLSTALLWISTSGTLFLRKTEGCTGRRSYQQPKWFMADSCMSALETRHRFSFLKSEDEGAAVVAAVCLSSPGTAPHQRLVYKTHLCNLVFPQAFVRPARADGRATEVDTTYTPGKPWEGQAPRTPEHSQSLRYKTSEHGNSLCNTNEHEVHS